MLKTLLSTAAVITALGSVSLAQEATEAEKPMVEAQEPAGTGEATDTMASDTAADPAEADPAVTAESEAAEIETGPTMMPVELSDITVGKLMDADLQTPGGEELGTIDDAKLGEGGTIESVVVSFGGFLGFGERTVELPLDDLKLMQDDAGNVAVETTLTPENIENLPDYEEAPES